jgi:hypothetical protein
VLSARPHEPRRRLPDLAPRRVRSFFKSQVEVVEKSRDRRFAHLHLLFRQPGFKLRQRAIRLFGHQRPHQIGVWRKSKCLVPAEFARLDTTRFALTPDEPPNSAQSQIIQFGDFLTGMTDVNCRNNAFAKIVRVRFSHP